MTQIRLNDDGTLDEIVGEGKFHIEQMGANCWLMEIGDIMFHVTSKSHVRLILTDSPSWAAEKARVEG